MEPKNCGISPIDCVISHTLIFRPQYIRASEARKKLNKCVISHTFFIAGYKQKNLSGKFLSIRQFFAYYGRDNLLKISFYINRKPGLQGRIAAV